MRKFLSLMFVGLSLFLVACGPEDSAQTDETAITSTAPEASIACREAYYCYAPGAINPTYFAALADPPATKLAKCSAAIASGACRSDLNGGACYHTYKYPTGCTVR